MTTIETRSAIPVPATGGSRSAAASSSGGAPVMSADALRTSGSDPRSAALAREIVDAWKGLSAMRATSEAMVYRDGKLVRSNVVDATYQAPQHCELNVVSGDGAGAQVTWNGGDMADVKKVLTFHWKLNNPHLANCHGWTLHDTGPGMVIRMLADPGTRTRMLPPEGGLRVIEARSPASPPGVTREELAIDPVRRLVVQRRLYNGNDLLGTFTVKDFTPWR